MLSYAYMKVDFARVLTLTTDVINLGVQTVQKEKSSKVQKEKSMQKEKSAQKEKSENKGVEKQIRLRELGTTPSKPSLDACVKMWNLPESSFWPPMVHFSGSNEPK